MFYYDYNALRKLLTQLSIIIDAKISIWNEKFQPTEANGITNNIFCSFLKTKDSALCAKTDKDALNKVNSTTGTIHYKCHMGFIEIMIKEYVDNTPFYFCVGPFADPKTKRKDMRRIKEYCELRHVDSKEYIKAYKEMPKFTLEKYESIISLINIVIRYCKETRIIATKEGFFESDIDPFLKENVSKNYSIDELSEKFSLTNKKFHLIVKKSTGLSPKQYITKLKLDKAYQDLIYTAKDLKTIATEVGIDDYNYFIKLFKTYKGHTPKYYRKDI